MTPPPRDEPERAISRLGALVLRARHGGWRGFSDEELELFPKLYRRVSTLVAEEETAGQDAAELRRRRALLLEAHALYRSRRSSARAFLRTLWRLYLVEVPRAVRREWKLVACSFALVYGLALVSGLLVQHDLELAFSLSSPEMIGNEIAQLQKTTAGEPFRGNFTFGLGESPATAGVIMAHNMAVGLLFFATGLVPPLFLLLLAVNGLMLGSYTAVAMHWGQGWSISSILWCHGTLEIQALLLAGAGGLVLVRGWIAPGPWTRRHALTLESARALRLLAPVFPMLFCAGTIEAFVSPHAPQGVRVAVALASLVLMIVWFGFGGRGEDD
jgi:uncharacterized membrane protein SpoIIM required for sporulation